MTTEKENSSQAMAVAESTTYNEQSTTRQTLNTGTSKMGAVRLSAAARHDRLNFPRYAKISYLQYRYYNVATRLAIAFKSFFF